MMTLVSCQSAASLQRERDQEAWERSLTPEQQVRLEAARMQALGLALSGGPLFHLDAQPQQPVRTYNPRLNCFTNEIGTSRYTNCY